MRVVMLSWEYPPKRVGGIAAALEGLAPALARCGVEVHVVTCGDAGGAAEDTPAPNLFIHRVLVEEASNDFFHWVHLLNAQMERRVDDLLDEWARKEKRRKTRKPTVLHVHDWLGQFAGISLKHRYRLPMLSTIHATEYGRNSGIYTETQRYINRCEWELAYESWRVIVCTEFMRREVGHALGVPAEKTDIIYNGVESDTFDFDFPADARAEFRSRFAGPHEKIIYFIGRMVWEKGAQVLIEALPHVLAQVPAKLVIAGGGERSHLESLARNFGVWDNTYFTGRISDEDRDRLYQVADAAVYPSLYEPFGIVALEAMAAGVPVVVSDAGGLPEVVQHNVSGTTTFAGDPSSLAWGIVRAFQQPEFAQWMAANAQERVRTVFKWDLIAHQTNEVYERVWNEYLASNWA